MSDDRTAKNGGVMCAATSRQTHKPCRHWARPGRKFCKWHGGKVPVGKDHPNFKHGKYSPYMPKQLQATYEAGLADPELIELRNEIALVDSRIQDLLRRSNWGESAKKWRQAQEAIRAVLTFQDQDDPESMAEAISECASILLGPSDHDAWAEILTTLSERRKLTDSERRRLEAANQVVTVAQLMNLAGAIGHLIRNTVEDAVTRRELADGLRRLMVREGYARTDNATLQGE
jgi:hypothetical protein